MWRFMRKRIAQTVTVLTVLAGLMTAPIQAADPGEALPNFTYEVDGLERSSADVSGEVLYIDFWASWCLPCRQSFPWMAEMHQRYAAQGLVILSINLDQEKALAEAFLREFPVSFLVSYDTNADIAELLKVVGMPTALLVGRDGIVRQRHIGFRDDSKAAYEREIQAALAE